VIRIIANSFTFRRIFSLRKDRFGSFVAYFLFLMLLVSFPLNYQIITSGGWDLYNFTGGIRTDTPAWLPDELPADIYISSSGMSYVDPAVSAFETIDVEGNPLFIVFAPEGGYVASARALIFEADRIVYCDASGAELFDVGYGAIETPVSFQDLRLMSSEDLALERFVTMIDEAFSAVAVFKSTILFTAITCILDVILVVVLSAIFLFVRVKYQKVTTFSENVRIVIASMTIPSLVGFFIGLLGLMEVNAFTVVLFQLITPLIAIFAILRGSGIKEASNKEV
jgi:hypothetical protein